MSFAQHTSLGRLPIHRSRPVEDRASRIGSGGWNSMGFDDSQIHSHILDYAISHWIRSFETESATDSPHNFEKS